MTPDRYTGCPKNVKTPRGFQSNDEYRISSVARLLFLVCSTSWPASLREVYRTVDVEQRAYAVNQIIIQHVSEMKAPRYSICISSSPRHFDLVARRSKGSRCFNEEYENANDDIGTTNSVTRNVRETISRSSLSIGKSVFHVVRCNFSRGG